MNKGPQAMLLEKREEPFDDPRYIFEPKIDGHRLLLVKDGESVKLWTRHENEVTQRYPELHLPPLSCSSCILDGEVAYVHPATGVIDFEAVMERFRMTKLPAIQEGMRRLPVQYFVFDVLEVNGRDVRRIPLIERTAILNSIMTETDHFRRVIQIDGRGKNLFEVIQQQKLEGIVAKRKNSSYVGRRSDQWLKMINYTYADVKIVGYRKDEFGWLAQHDGRTVGVIELSVPGDHRKAFNRIAQNIVTGEDKNFVYVKPLITARIRMRSWYKSGTMRTPEFVQFVI
ncbi:ATP-dependent DNA ligase [Paenibacillus glycanilyticus]|uniref:ATP-dependent DNA ligase n=1 Tax=Paenibacillus glycanilyticus TaxID=126569 RepID=UPI001FD20D20|nr:RNA ligase family protein [Paenibacillus glycanilyticus]